MAEPTSSTPSTDPDAIVEEYLKRIDAGEQIDREAYIAKHPDVAPALRSFFANEQLMRQWTSGSMSPAAKDTAPKDASPTIAPKSISAAALTSSTGSITFPAMMGRYRLERELGRGAMGTVYLAHDTDLDRPVALKIPKFTAADNQELIARFLREARAAAVLAHPNICRVYDVNEHQGVRYIAMEFIEGKPLSAFIAGGNVQPKQAASVVRKLALGLAEAHQRNILHRDLKPDNILVNKQGEPVLTDFGLARETTAGKATATQDGVILGSPAYMPPEQAAGNLSEMGPSSDIYSLGVVLYELLTGEVPFRGSVVEVLASVLMKTPKTVREQKPGVDPGLAAICDKMMSKKAADRYQTMMAVAQALGDWLRTGGQQQPATSTKLPEPMAASGEFKLADPKSKLAAGPHVVEPKKIPGVSDKPKQTIAPTATKVPERSEKQINELAELGDQLLVRNDYLEAIRLAEEIPDYQRTSALRRVLGEAYELKGKVEKLERNLEKHLNLLDLPELKKTVTALLKIHPGHPRGKEIKKALNTGGKKAVVQILKDEGNFDAVGNVWEPKLLAGGVAAIIALAVVAYFAVTIYIKGTMQEVAITIDDPTASVKIDGKDVLIEGQQTGSVKLTIGNHDYTVTQGGTVVRNAQNFTVSKDGQNKLVITLKEPEKKPEPPTDVNKPSPTKVAGGNPNVFDGHTAPVIAVCVSPDSKYVFSASHDKTLRGWDVATGKMIFNLECSSPLSSVACSPNGKLVAAGGNDVITICEVPSGKQVGILKGHVNEVQGVAFSQDSRQVVSGGIDLTVRVWDVASFQEVRQLKASGSGQVQIRVTPDGKEVVSATGGGFLESWNLETGEPLAKYVGHDAAVIGASLSQDGQFAAGASNDQTVNLWNQKSRELLHRFKGHTGRVMAVDFFPSGRYLASGGLDKQIIVWDWETKQQVAAWKAHHEEYDGVRGLAVAPNGQFIVSGGYDAKVRVWKSPVESTVAASGNAPPPAVAPFDAMQAKAHQEAWAKHLGVPVEYTNKLGMKFRLIPPGEFVMGGTPDEIKEWAAQWDQNNAEEKDIARAEGPQHKVRITKPYYLGMHEVTQKDYEAILKSNPSQHRADSDNADVRTLLKGQDTSRFPVENVAWNDVQRFCQALSARDGAGSSYRLPTEAEWEYACRAGTTTRNWNGNSPQQAAEAANIELNRPRYVGEMKANPFGLHDMNGNVWEWVQDWWDPDYYQQFSNQTAIDPIGPNSGKWRGIRGCSLGQDALRARSSLRFRDAPATTAGGRGFRVALPVEAVSNSKTAASVAPGSSASSDDLKELVRSILKIGGQPVVRVRTTQQLYEFNQEDQIPNEPFDLYGVNFMYSVDRAAYQSVAAKVFRAPMTDTIESLAWMNKSITSEDVKLAAKCRNLRSLRLAQTGVDDEVMPLLSNWPQLEQLLLPNTKVTPQGMAHVASLKKLQTLTCNDTIDDDALAHLRGLTELTVLHLMGTNIRGPGLKHLAGLTRLQTLILIGQQLDDEALRLLPPLPALEGINLGNVPIGDKGLEHLTSYRKLQQLSVDGTRVTGESMKIAGQLPELRILTWNASATDDDLAHLKDCTELVQLSLSGAKIRGPGLKHLARCSKLNILYLSLNKLDDDGLKSLPTSLPIANLSLENNPAITDESVAHLKRLTALTSLNLTGAKLTAAGVAQLKQQLPKVQVVGP